MRERISRVVVLALSLGAMACTERGVSWVVAYEPEALATDVSELYLEVREGSCAGPAVFASSVDGSGNAPTLTPGTYGFVARVSDRSCQWFATGCEERTLPLAEGDTITVVLREEPRGDRCTGSCVGGRCPSERDAGVTQDGSTPSLLAVEVATGRAHSCARTRRDEVYCWGLNESLQVGAITGAVEQLAPVQVQGLAGAVALSAGGNGQPKDGHSCAVVAGGAVRCWGDNLVGQLGTGAAGAARAEPQLVVGVGGARGIDSGRQHSCAITTSSEVFCWGANEVGQLGTTPAANGVPTPVRVPGLGSLMQIAVGDAHSCASRGSGTVECWGDNGSGQLGNSDAENPSEMPVSVQGLRGVASIALGGEFSCALEMTGGVVCWGSNRNGVLGDSSYPSGASPQRVMLPDRPAAELAAGEDFACARMAAGDVYCWGSNQWGALGRGDTASGGVATPGPVVDLTDVTDISASDNHVCAVTVSGGVVCWGRGQQGRLGNGDVQDRAAPTAVVGFGG